MSLRKPAKGEFSKDPIHIVQRKKKSYVGGILDDINKASATKQVALGISSGCITGFVATRIGKIIAIAIGGGIIILQIANHQGYIRINWTKVHSKMDKVMEKVEEQLTGEKPGLMDKMERFVDRKLDETEDILKSRQAKAKRWYSSLTGDSSCKIKEIHIFLASFLAGVAIGMVVS
ncbi:hypothetical protein AMK59_3919 [Oryctes borbonicus]|uniref:FUN14 domain-containing protein n=1 Tax=Oryctes borbonicus TaxID=1629725 RepID=A0A0T6B4V8_9SCAR|nr:hypothetical protein AMK59_3919 [Oryctes borbonicus]